MSDHEDRSEWAEKVWSGQIDPEPDQAQLESNRQLMRRIFEEIWNNGNFDLVNEAFTSDLVDTTAAPGLPPGRQGYIAHVSMLRSAFPDFHVSLEQIVAEDNRLAARLACRGTHKGNLFGIAPTGKAVTIGGMVFAHVKNDKIFERWAIFDIPGLMQQIGPAPQRSSVASH
jgi:predicted ester cyclase